METIDLTTPMNMVFSYGCTVSELSVNGIEEMDMTDSQREIIIHRIMKWYKEHPEYLNSLLRYFIEATYDDYEFSDPCECCGDCISTFKVTI